MQLARGDRRTGRTAGPSARIVRVGGVLAAVVGTLAVAAPADGRSVHDRDIGWPAALRQSLDLPALDGSPCRERTTRAKIRLQGRVSDREPPLRGLLRYGEADVWGSSWYTNCDGGRLQIGVAGGAPAAATRRIVRRLRDRLDERGLTEDVRLVAVRSTYKQLVTEADRIGTTVVPGALEAEHVSTDIDTTRNAVNVDVYDTATPAELTALRALVRDSPVNITLHVEAPADPGAPIPEYAGAISLERGAVDRSGRDVRVRVDDQSCASDETFDSAARFAGVSVRRGRHAWILSSRFRVNPTWPRASTCEGVDDPRLVVRTTIRLPARLGRRGIVDGSAGEREARPILLEPEGADAIRSLVPRFRYSGALCDVPAVERAFSGRAKSAWCSV
ncbi:hypothetical protein [Patulibacter sp.]|uniref:hypothetical protein n=1 Tax=Patulibacter sp. TaxID=1912859 RepID=UPI002721BF9E|nr:hypothetical protein [Patulibacter sp.]MDO9410476.1 hypothetical protein [Patulibacter sp.]